MKISLIRFRKKLLLQMLLIYKTLSMGSAKMQKPAADFRTTMCRFLDPNFQRTLAFIFRFSPYQPRLSITYLQIFRFVNEYKVQSLKTRFVARWPPSVSQKRNTGSRWANRCWHPIQNSVIRWRQNSEARIRQIENEKFHKGNFSLFHRLLTSITPNS